MASHRDVEAMRVVVAEDDPLARMMLRRILAKWGYEVLEAEDGATAWDALRASGARMLVSDWAMPELTGVDLCKKIRAGTLPYYVYTILLTSKDEKEEILEGFSSGADDYLTKPFDRDELRARVTAGARIVTLEQQLRDARERLEIMAATDELTGISNRRAALSRLQQSLARAEREGRELTVVMLDVDHFKRLNDTHGHASGDAVLREFAERVAVQLREYDVFGRVGGEEFIVVLPDLPLDAGCAIAERVRASISDVPFVLPTGATVTATVSVGVSSAGTDEHLTVDRLLAIADAALYEAKAAGRNRVVVGDPARVPNRAIAEGARERSRDDARGRDREAA